MMIAFELLTAASQALLPKGHHGSESLCSICALAAMLSSN